MVEMTVSQVVCATDAQLIAGSGTRVCSGVCIDSRNVEPGMLFVAFPGERVDGNTYAPRAAQAGAACVVITADPTEELLAICAEKTALSCVQAKTMVKRFSCVLQAHGVRITPIG